ncbi:MAG: hypothetical protein KDC95_11655 [Planctomycetes bacterium]|nr:hypothetical protein [Planctomycetota bacterium]
MIRMRSSITAVFCSLLLLACDEVSPDTVLAQDGNRASSKRDAQDSKKSETAPEEVSDEAKRFMRWKGEHETEGRYQTSIAHYTDAAGRKVDLVAVVHIGDSGYYADLEKRFRSYDAVLYELVAPKGTRPSQRDESRPSLITRIQRLMKNSLGLVFQLDAIDYDAKNFVHADLSPKQFLEKQEERGESMVTLMIRMMLAGMQNQKDAPPITTFHILAGMNDPNYLKFLFAQQLEQVENLLAALGGSNGEKSTIIGDRNAAAMAVLEEQLDEGAKSVAIFYGAAHMPDMEKRVRALGFEPAGVEWLTAWNVMLTDEERAKRAKLEAEKTARREEILERRRKRAEAKK